LVLAGLNPSGSLQKLVNQTPNVTLVPNPSQEEMNTLITDAQVNILVTFQPTGLKLKLLNALFNGRFCLVNPGMVIGTELANLCEIADNAEELRQKLDLLMTKSFDEEQLFIRRAILLKWHSNKENCNRLLNLLSLLSRHGNIRPHNLNR
jgi:hypothetical protein